MRIDLILWASVIASLAFLVNEPGRAINPETFFPPQTSVRFLSCTHLRSTPSFLFGAVFPHPKEACLSDNRSILNPTYTRNSIVHLAPPKKKMTLQLPGLNSHGHRPHRTFTADAVMPVLFFLLSRTKGGKRKRRYAGLRFLLLPEKISLSTPCH